MEDEERNNEALSCFTRIKPIMEEYFDNWIITAHRVGCGTKVIIGDYDRKKPDMNQLMSNAKEWKANTLGDTG